VAQLGSGRLWRAVAATWSAPVVAGTMLLGATALPLGASASQSGAGARERGSVPCPATVHVAPTVSWPAPAWKACFPGTITESSPTFATFREEAIVAVGDERGYVHVLDAATGAELPGWPRAMAAPRGQHAAIEGSPTIAFLDGPNRPPSIIVGSASTWVHDTVGELEAFRLDGARRFVFRVGAATGTAVGVFSSPAVGDLAGNGQVDIVFGSWDHNLYALDRAGHLLPGFPVNNADTIWSSPSLYHLPGVRGEDIYLGSDASGLDGCVGGWVSDYRYVRGAPRLVWRHCERQSIWSSPAVGVINGTHQPVVVVGTSFYEQPFPQATYRLYAFYARSGRPVRGWPVTTSGPTLGSPAIGNVDGGTTASVVDTSFVCAGSTDTSCVSTNVSRVSAWSGSGRLRWSQTLRGPTDFASPVLVPLLDHAQQDVLVGSPDGLYPLDGATGAYLYGTGFSNQWAAINPGCRVFSSVAVGAVPGRGEYVFESCGGPPGFGVPGEVAAYRLPLQSATPPAWPMFRADAAHDGTVPPTAPPGTQSASRAG
jgi:hypothetical protein